MSGHVVEPHSDVMTFSADGAMLRHYYVKTDGSLEFVGHFFGDKAVAEIVKKAVERNTAEQMDYDQKADDEPEPDPDAGGSDLSAGDRGDDHREEVTL
jgi:hypothetical protein